MLEENKALVHNFLQKANREGRTPLELCAPGFTAHIEWLPAMDLQAFQKYQSSNDAGFLDSRITIEDMVAEGDRAAFRGVVQAVHMAEFMGSPASGKQISVPFIGITQRLQRNPGN